MNYFKKFIGAVKTYKPNPGIDNYERVIHRLFDQGFMVPPSRVTELWENIQTTVDANKIDLVSPDLFPKYGIIFEAHHERSGYVEVYIDSAAEEWKKRGLDVKKYYLLPVKDDSEYISWDFFYIGIPEATEKLKQLRKDLGWE